VFVAIYLVEVVTRSRINIVQYVVTGLSLCLFYLLLLSVSEHLSFAWSYIIASAMTVGALGGYFYGFLKSKVALLFTGAVAFLYGFIYVLLQMETGGLLMGSMALFILLAVVMYFTRNDRFIQQYRGPVVE
jgi:inner membrane protein